MEANKTETFGGDAHANSQNKFLCKNWVKCNDYSGMVMDSTAVDCHGCPAYVPSLARAK